MQRLKDEAIGPLSAGETLTETLNSIDDLTRAFVCSRTSTRNWESYLAHEEKLKTSASNRTGNDTVPLGAQIVTRRFALLEQQVAEVFGEIEAFTCEYISPVSVVLCRALGGVKTYVSVMRNDNDAKAQIDLVEASETLVPGGMSLRVYPQDTDINYEDILGVPEERFTSLVFERLYAVQKSLAAELSFRER